MQALQIGSAADGQCHRPRPKPDIGQVCLAAKISWPLIMDRRHAVEASKLTEPTGPDGPQTFFAVSAGDIQLSGLGLTLSVAPAGMRAEQMQQAAQSGEDLAGPPIGASNTSIDPQSTIPVKEKILNPNVMCLNINGVALQGEADTRQWRAGGAGDAETGQTPHEQRCRRRACQRAHWPHHMVSHR